MSGYLSSTESLDKLCETQPDKPIKYGIGKVSAGIGLIGLAGGLGYLGWNIRDGITNPIDGTFKAITIGMEVIIGAAGLASAGGGIYFLADGVTSLAKPLGMHYRDGSVYYRNGGYTNRPSISDKKYGSKVIPIENANELSPNDKGYVLLNGITVKSTKIDSEVKTRLMPITTFNGKTSTTTYIPSSYTEYTAELKGELRGSPVKLFTVTEDGDFAKSLAAEEKDSMIFAVGEVDKQGDIDLKQVGEAFKK